MDGAMINIPAVFYCFLTKKKQSIRQKNKVTKHLIKVNKEKELTKEGARKTGCLSQNQNDMILIPSF